MALRSLLRIKSDVDAAACQVAFVKIQLLFKFDPNQPRVPVGNAGGGQWTSQYNNEEQSGNSNNYNAESQRYAQISERSQEYCDEQYKRDVFHCKMVGLRSYYAQAMVRLVACERGHSIPPLNY
jgi:hypothetical protein